MKRPAPHRLAQFASLREKADWIDASASLDSATVPVRRLAAHFVRESKTPAQLARAIHAWVRDRIAYQHDRPTMGPIAMGEELASSEEILRRGCDDCDGKARLFVALCRAAGLDARIVPVFPDPEHFAHVQGEVRYPGSQHEDGAQDGGWLRAELILKGVPLGGDPEKAPRDRMGHRILAGPGR